MSTTGTQRLHGRWAMISMFALGSAAFTGCGQADGEDVRVVQSAVTSETTRIIDILEEGTDGQPGFLLKPVGGPIQEGFNEDLVQDPASSIKTLIAVSLLQAIEAGGGFDLDTEIPFPTDMNGSCPLGTGPEVTKTLRQWMFEMQVFSDNTATRALVDFLGGFAAINATASDIGMTSTSMDGHVGCLANRITQVDLALLYEGIADGSLISNEHRAELFAAMPADGGDFSGTLFRARAIVDEEASAAGVSGPEADLFKSQLALHYKAGNGCCPSIYTISGLAEIPTCNGATQSSTEYVWGLFLAEGSFENINNNASVFFANQVEPLRTPIRESLATWHECAAGSVGGTGAPCAHNGECDSFVCGDGTCQPASCAPTCNQGAPCGSDADCGSGVCGTEGTCQPPACSPHCDNGEVCANNSDCASFVCADNQCASPACAPTCNQGAPCGSNADCNSGICTDGLCAG